MCLWCGVVVLWSVATSKGIMVPPVVCPRLFEFLTTWTLITLCQQQLGPSRKNAKRSNKEGIVVPRAVSNVSGIVKNTTEIGRECCVKKRSHVHGGFFKKESCNRT